jgi:hypothetical protein
MDLNVPVSSYVIFNSKQHFRSNVTKHVTTYYKWEKATSHSLSTTQHRRLLAAELAAYMYEYSCRIALDNATRYAVLRPTIKMPRITCDLKIPCKYCLYHLIKTTKIISLSDEGTLYNAVHVLSTSHNLPYVHT